jgi:hypothetical protein
LGILLSKLSLTSSFHIQAFLPLDLTTNGQKKQKQKKTKQKKQLGVIYLFIYFVVLGLELRAFTLSHSTSLFL